LSYAVDANILLYASDAASPFNHRARTFLETCVSGSEIFCLAWSTVMAYLRIATHPGVFQRPLSPGDAVANLEPLVRLPHVRMLAEEEGYWEVYREVTQGMVIRGNLVMDAHLAALLRQHGIRSLYTNDSDFRKFRFLEVRNPFV
jgi:toxin-antitoxin system PIN domain toxin